MWSVCVGESLLIRKGFLEHHKTHVRERKGFIVLLNKVGIRNPLLSLSFTLKVDLHEHQDKQDKEQHLQCSGCGRNLTCQKLFLSESVLEDTL